MFGVGFFELILIGGVALVVLGPEKLTRVARTAGLLWVRMQRHVAEVKADIHRELELEELKRMRAELAESAQAIGQSVQEQVREIHETVVEPIKAEIAHALEPVVEPEPEPEPAPHSEPAEPILATVLAEPVPEAAPSPLHEDAAPVDDAQLDLFGSPLASPPSPSPQKH